MASGKSPIIEALFRQRWDAKRRQLLNPIVTLEDVKEAIEEGNRSLPASKRMSTKNPANFFKDFIRDNARANKNWPRAVLDAGYTGRQAIGGGNCFEFIPLPRGQTMAFSLAAGPTPTTPRHRIESASLPVASRRLGRAEETWIIQVAVRLRIIETHLTIFSSRRDRIIQVDHLQISAKIGPEIDALFLALENGEAGARQEAMVSVEAKGARDDILEGQIIEQVRALFKLPTINIVIPMAIKVVGKSELYVVEYQAVAQREASALASLAKASDAVYELHPPVPGIG